MQIKEVDVDKVELFSIVQHLKIHQFMRVICMSQPKVLICIERLRVGKILGLFYHSKNDNSPAV